MVMNANLSVHATPLHNTNLDLIFSTYPALADEHNSAWLNLLDRVTKKTIAANTTLLCTNMPCENFTFLLQGQVRIYQVAEDGREVTLYRVNPGDVCAMSLNSLVNNNNFKANAVSETEIHAITLNTDDFQQALAISAAFRNMVLSSLTSSFCDMMSNFHDMVFNRLEMRLACLLGQLFERSQSDSLCITHQTIAHELGTTREVISRILKQMEQEGCIKLSRGKIQRISDKKLSSLQARYV